MLVRRLLVALAVLATTLAFGSSAAPAGAAAKDPVIVVAGFTTGPLIAPGYAPLVARLRADGYTTEILYYEDYGVGDIATQSAKLRDRVNALKARTGASKVDLVAHSMGGLVSRYYVKNLGGSAHVDSLIMLGTPNYGTSIANIASFLTLGTCIGITACQQMAIGSSFLNALNAGDDTIGNVRYTSIATSVDLIVTPYTTSFLANDGNIQNVRVQSQCWLRFPGHLALILDGAVYDGVRDALRGQTVRMNCFAL
ncbi:MAG: alpha/beta fold hydrolase [Acidimicrobiales bacterium]|nr:alpha/beta fold hydrolase [Acidimicrobiales bacterium]